MLCKVINTWMWAAEWADGGQNVSNSGYFLKRISAGHQLLAGVFAAAMVALVEWLRRRSRASFGEDRLLRNTGVLSAGTVTLAECCCGPDPPTTPVAQISNQLLKSQCQYHRRRAAKCKPQEGREFIDLTFKSLVIKTHVCNDVCITQVMIWSVCN